MKVTSGILHPQEFLTETEAARKVFQYRNPKLTEKAPQKNNPFGCCLTLFLQQCALKSPQYIECSGLPNTFAGAKSLSQKPKGYFYSLPVCLLPPLSVIVRA